MTRYFRKTKIRAWWTPRVVFGMKQSVEGLFEEDARMGLRCSKQNSAMFVLGCVAVWQSFEMRSSAGHSGRFRFLCRRKRRMTKLCHLVFQGGIRYGIVIATRRRRGITFGLREPSRSVQGLGVTDYDLCKTRCG